MGARKTVPNGRLSADAFEKIPFDFRLLQLPTISMMSPRRTLESPLRECLACGIHSYAPSYCEDRTASSVS